MSNSIAEMLYKTLICQYLNDGLGKQMWTDIDLESICNFESEMKNIFMHGACVDFANGVSILTDWPIFEIQWGDVDPQDPDDCEELKGIHRVIQHPSGHFFDASGWTDLDNVLGVFNAHGSSYVWMGEVDYGAEVFNVDIELVKEAVKYLVPENCILTPEIHCNSTSSMGM